MHRMHHWHHIPFRTVWLCSSLCAAILMHAATVSAQDRLFHESRPAMGSTFDIYLYTSDETAADELFEAAFDEIERIEQALSNYRPTSELSRINANAAEGPVVTDPEVFGVIQQSLHYSDLTEGAFDIAVGSLMQAWGFFRGKGRVATHEEIDGALRASGWRNVELDDEARTVFFRREDLTLDLGGIGKGYTVDRVADLLRGFGIEAALIQAGQSSFHAVGAPPGTSGWRVQIPVSVTGHEEARSYSVILSDNSLSTSGDSQKAFEHNGQRYSHIMDPRSGRPATGLSQVTVIAPTAIEGDVWSTAVYVLGLEEAVRKLREHPQIEALALTADRRIEGINWSDLQFADYQESR